jgi:hypothetical protein
MLDTQGGVNIDEQIERHSMTWVHDFVPNVILRFAQDDVWMR